MGNVRVKVSDVSGSRINEVEAPDDIPINRILVVLIEKMNLPLNSPDGQLMSYKLHHRRTASQLLDSQTLGQANVVSGDELRLQPEITAGKTNFETMPSTVPSAALQIGEGRFARFEAIEWWNQARLAEARILVVGAGALGNEVIKNLALLGIGHLAIADMDRVELSNLSRSVLFRQSDERRFKAECAAERALEIYAGMRVKAVAGNILTDLGLGWFRWADVIVGALDNREARVFVNSACARVGRVWFDGGIEVLHGVGRGFAPPKTACYECTMSKVDWDLLNKRRSCSLLARRAVAARGTPTTPLTASVIGAVQVAEVVKHLHQLESLLGRGLVYDGAGHASYTVDYRIDPDCPWHQPPASIEAIAAFDSTTPMERIWAEATRRLGGLDALDLAREVVLELECPVCHRRQGVCQQPELIPADLLQCPACQVECVPSFVHSITPGSPLLTKCARELGLPPWDICWARSREQCLGIELAGDNPWGSANVGDIQRL